MRGFDTPDRGTGRRLVLAGLAAPVLQGCVSPLPLSTAPVTTAEAKTLLDASAAAHGLAAFMTIRDISISYAGVWRPVIGTLQPALVDRAFRGQSQERLILAEGLTGQAHAGPDGRKQVTRRTAVGGQGAVNVWYNGGAAAEAERIAAAALVSDGYALFLFGPLLAATSWMAGKSMVLDVMGTERLIRDGREYTCDLLRARITPGIGLSDSDQVVLYIDRDERLMRRARFTLNGLKSTRGAIAEVDTSAHVIRSGVRWPTRFHEHLLRPLSLPVHDWSLTGLDVDRGLVETEVTGPVFTGKALPPAASV